MINEHCSSRRISAVDLGRTRFAPVWELQRQLFALREAGRSGDLLLLNEHEHVYTFGKSGDTDHLLASAEELSAAGVEVYSIDRGGDVTYHGPGQIVGYPILNLNPYGADLHRYLRNLEEVIIRTAADVGVTAHRDARFTGVWVGSDKLAAIGVKASRWITMHGFALNVNTDLRFFDRIIPCGIFHKGVTSLRQILGRELPLDEVKRSVVKRFGEVFDAEMIERSSADLHREIHYTPDQKAECLQ